MRDVFRISRRAQAWLVGLILLLNWHSCSNLSYQPPFLADRASLKKDPDERADLQDLMIHPWVKTFAEVPFDLAAWAKSTLPKEARAESFEEDEPEVDVERANRIYLPAPRSS